MFADTARQGGLVPLPQRTHPEDARPGVHLAPRRVPPEDWRRFHLLLRYRLRHR